MGEWGTDPVLGGSLSAIGVGGVLSGVVSPRPGGGEDLRGDLTAGEVSEEIDLVGFALEIGGRSSSVAEVGWREGSTGKAGVSNISRSLSMSDSSASETLPAVLAERESGWGMPRGPLEWDEEEPGPLWN